MSNTRKVSLSGKTAEDRPTKKESRAETLNSRPERVPLTGHRDKLTVRGKDPEYQYRFVKDVCDTVTDNSGSIQLKPGNRILRFQAAGWEFVNSDDVQVGAADVYKTENIGSIVRIPAGLNEFLYLMRIRKDWYQEDQKTKEKELLDVEKELSGKTTESGMYGSVSIDNDYKFLGE